MGNFCSELITSVMVLPITAGYYRRRQNGSGYYDGTISSMVFFIVFLSIVIVFTVSQDIDIEQDKRLAIVFLLLSTIMIFGMIACVALVCVIKKLGVEYVVSSRRQGSVIKLQLIFLSIFGLLAGLFSALLVGQQIECGVFSPNIVGIRGFFWDNRCIFNIITMLFLVVEMLFISYFARFHLKRSTSVRYVLFLLVCANVSVWLHSVIINNEPFPERILDREFGNKSKIPACLQKATFGNLINISQPILKPCFLEFCLLSITMLLEMWSPITIQQTSEEELPIYQEMVDSSYHVNETERATLLEHTEFTESILSGGHTNEKVYQLVSFFVSIIIGLVFITFYVIWVSHPDSSQIRKATDQYYASITVAMLVAVFVGFYCLVHYCKPERTPKPLKVSEYVYLSSALGIVMLHVCEVLSAYITPDDTKDILMSTYILALVQVYLQVVFLLHASRCRKTVTNSRIHLLECVLIFLIIINLTIWISDSFVIEQFVEIKAIEQDILGDVLWSLYHNILLPASVFFRFSSALEMFATFQLHSARH